MYVTRKYGFKQKKDTKVSENGDVSCNINYFSLCNSFSYFSGSSIFGIRSSRYPNLIGTFAFGPFTGLLLTIATSIIQGITVSANSGLYGILMHIIATSTLVIIAGHIYCRNKTRKAAIIGLLCGMLAMAMVMVVANLIITPLFMGVTQEVVWGLMPFIVGFNLIKAGINGLVTFFLYKRISEFLHE